MLPRISVVFIVVANLWFATASPPTSTTTKPSSAVATTNVSVTCGSTVDLSCSVTTDDGRPPVIVWLQDEQFRVLFYGPNRVTDDKRMSVRLLVEEGETKSTLRIEPVKEGDQGLFICRVPRKDSIYTEKIHLLVKPAKVSTTTDNNVPKREVSTSTGATIAVTS